uniref:SWIM-type domain-containing protein n=2 Tax=Clytia hemisphaerica TaxID=252671 RepID=A0A7M5X4D8_9CNID
EHEDVYVVRKGRNGSAYNVMFVTEGGMPSCECFSWKKTKLPCKHMFSIILNNLEHWESFSEFYRHLPYMTLDEEICPSPRSVGQEQQPSSGAQLPTEDITMASDDDSKADPFFPELPRKVTKSLTRRSHCREMLKEVMSATHNYGLDEETIEELEERILDLKIFLEEKLPRDDGLVIESKKEAMKQVSNKNVKQNEENPASSNSCNNKGATFIELPKPKSKKKLASGRVGIGAEKRRFHGDIRVNSPGKKKKIEPPKEKTKEAEPNENDVNEVDKEVIVISDGPSRSKTGKQDNQQEHPNKFKEDGISKKKNNAELDNQYRKKPNHDSSRILDSEDCFIECSEKQGKYFHIQIPGRA